MLGPTKVFDFRQTLFSTCSQGQIPGRKQRRSSPSPFTSETHISASLLPFPSSPGCQSSLRSAPEDSLPCSRANNPTAAALTSRKVAPGRGLQSLQLWTSTLLLPNKRFAPHARVNPRYVRPWPPASSGGGHAASASTADNFFFFLLRRDLLPNQIWILDIMSGLGVSDPCLP